MLNRDQIRIRDPFVLVENETYYLYGTTDRNPWDGEGTGFEVYQSPDLSGYTGPFPAFRPEAGFWGKQNFWAPEVYFFQGAYWMLASFKGKGCRGVQAFRSDSPVGPFCPVSAQTLTPPDWECLDGTLWLGQDGPWLVFSHEWLQTGDGEICAAKLNAEMNGFVEAPVKLFTASEAPWTVAHCEFGHTGYVTDGPFLHACGDRLIMIWSSYGEHGYAIGQCASDHGIKGPWVHCREPLYAMDGGHGMVFRRLDGTLMLTFHSPNRFGEERASFYPVREKDGWLGIIK